MATMAQKRRVMKARKAKGWAARLKAMDEAETRREKRRKRHEKTFTELRIEPQSMSRRAGYLNAWRLLDPDDLPWATPAQWSFYLAALADPSRPHRELRRFVLGVVLRASGAG